MNGRCETCERESLCGYPYKPTECCDYRKFELRQDAIECPECCGIGHESCYPILCKTCDGLGMVVPSNAGTKDTLYPEPLALEKQKEASLVSQTL